MSTPWPTASVAFEAQQGSWRGQREDNVLRTENEVGPPKRRRRTYLPNHLVQFTMLVTTAELEAILDFYDVDLVDGIGSFTAVDPQLGTTQEYQFVEPPSERDAGHDLWEVEVSLRRLA